MPDEEDGGEDVAPDDDLLERKERFIELGFDEITAWALAHTRASWSEARERFLKRGASLEITARYFLGGGHH
jgi:hypothetical protein